MATTTFFRVADTTCVTLIPDEGEPLLNRVKHKSINEAKRESRRLQAKGMKFVRPA